MTSLERYLARLRKQKALAENRFTDLSGFETTLINSSFDWLLNNLNTKAGTFEAAKNLPGLMNSFVDNILKVADKSSSYNKAVFNYLSDLEDISANIQEFHKDYNKISIQTPRVKNVQVAVVDEILNQYQGNGLNAHFAQPLRELVYSNVLGQMSQQDAKQYLKDYIAGGKDQSGKLSKYVEQTAIQGVDSYTGAINMKINQEFEFTGYIISGSLIDTSSKQCIYAIETSADGYLSFADWEKVLEMARNNKKAPLIEGTTIENLPLNKLHRGCRHEFTPAIVKA
jgi:hypothetical protein